jgi:type II secretory pathway pseudopilin PulG
VRPAGRGTRVQSGYALVALLAGVAIMLILMAAAAPSWRYLVKNDKEEELLFRGGEIADGIARYQRRNGNALPASLEVLVKGKFLRHAYKDPMTRDGGWRLIHPGEALLGPLPGSQPGSAGRGNSSATTATTTTTTTTLGSAFSRGSSVGVIQGVASTSSEESLRIFNGRTRYNEWLFLAGQPRNVGRPAGRPAVPAPGGPVLPGAPGVGAPAPPNLAPPPPPA